MVVIFADSRLRGVAFTAYVKLRGKGDGRLLPRQDSFLVAYTNFCA